MSTNNTGDTPSNGTGENQEGRGDSNPTDNSQQCTPRPNTRRPTRSRDGINQDTKIFKGETAKMNGHVFQTHTERRDKSQFEDTMEALRIYTSSVYK